MIGVFLNDAQGKKWMCRHGSEFLFYSISVHAFPEFSLEMLFPIAMMCPHKKYKFIL
jgi:hypothetical protein